MGGPYIECEGEDLNQQNLQNFQQRFYFDLKRSKDNSVTIYFQKKDVSDRPNPPFSSKYTDRRNRTGGYSNMGRFYISPDDIFIEKDNQTFPSENKTLQQDEKTGKTRI